MNFAISIVLNTNVSSNFFGKCAQKYISVQTKRLKIFLGVQAKKK